MNVTLACQHDQDITDFDSGDRRVTCAVCGGVSVVTVTMPTERQIHVRPYIGSV